MKRSFVIKAGKIRQADFSCSTIILLALFLCGIITGAFIIKNCDEDIKNALSIFLKSLISSKAEKGFTGNFCAVFMTMLIFIAVVFFSGLCATGTPIICVIPIFFGIFGGGYFSLMLVNYGIKGLLYCIAVDLGLYAITAASLIKCCCEGIKMSVELMGNVIGRGSTKKWCTIREYIICFSVLCIPVIAGALICTTAYTLFKGLFIFT